MPLPDDQPEMARAELERAAFGRAETPAELAAAAAALRLIVAADAAERAAAELQAQHVEAMAAEIRPFEATAEVEPIAVLQQSHPLWRAKPVPLLACLAAGIAIGIIVGVAHVAPTARVADPRPTPSALATANPAAALKLLLVTQSSADTEFPLHSYATSLDIQPASIHVALENSEGDTVWVGRTGNDLCMMWTSQPKDGSVEGGAKCVSPGSFAREGLRLTHDSTVWTWDGTHFTVDGI
jgi:hypothetical protein